MVTFASTSRLLFLIVRLKFGNLISSNASLGLKQTITTDGIWRIMRRERSPVIEVFKEEESDYGDILSSEFVQWRNGRDGLKQMNKGPEVG